MIFIDRSIPKPVAEALKLVRNDVAWLEDLFDHRPKDEDWLKEAGRQGWIVILRDKKIRTRPRERQAIIDNRVGCFIVSQSKDPTKWEYLRLIVSNLDKFEERDAETPRPYIFTVARDGALSQVLQEISR